ncbi:MAG: fatty acid desaturase family protein [Hyphomicrobiaceae bacterium]|nr:fatty acid desaturase family protein [Hyphomicrobiaceae bacterium]
MRPRNLLTEQQLAIVRERHDWKGLALVAHAWVVILGAMALFAWWPNPVTWLVAAAIIGGRQLGLAILMHDGAHGLLLKDATWNLRLSQWFCGWPIGADTVAYRRYHLKHHARTQQDDDPDLVLSAPFPVTRDSFWRKLLRDITGRSGLAQRVAQIRAGLGKPDQTRGERLAYVRDKLGGFLATNLMLFGALALAGYWWLYPLLWVLPLLTFFQLFLRLRNIAEHAMVGDKDDPFRHARTTLAGPVARMFVAPYWVNYHVEHHLFMWVPCYNLPKLHAMLRAGEAGERLLVSPSYLDVFRLVTSGRGNGPGRPIQTTERRFAGLVMDVDEGRAKT